MKLSHIHVWSALQLLTVLWWIYIQETASCYVIKGSEQIAKQGGSCTRIWVNKCSLDRKRKNSSCLQERELETRETELGREFTVHEKPIDSKEIFIQMLVLATQDNGQKIFYETLGQKATEDTYITKSGKTVSMKWIRKVFLNHFGLWLSLYPQNYIRLETFSFYKIFTIKIWEIQEQLFLNSFSKPIVTTIKKTKQNKTLSPKITKSEKNWQCFLFC